LILESTDETIPFVRSSSTGTSSAETEENEARVSRTRNFACIHKSTAAPETRGIDSCCQSAKEAHLISKEGLQKSARGDSGGTGTDGGMVGVSGSSELPDAAGGEAFVKVGEGSKTEGERSDE